MSDGTTHPHDPSTDPATAPTEAGGPPPGWGQPGAGQPGGPAGSGPPPGYDPATGGPPPGWVASPGGAPAGGPPPGYGAPASYGAGGYPAAPTGGGTKVSTGALLAVVSIAAMALAVSLKEDGDNGWGRIGVWAAFAIVAAVLTLAPAIGEQLNLTAQRAWQAAVAGAVGLAAFWVLFVLPSISQNVSFAATVGVAAGIGAAWVAPGRPSAPGAGQTW